MCGHPRFITYKTYKSNKKYLYIWTYTLLIVNFWKTLIIQNGTEESLNPKKYKNGKNLLFKNLLENNYQRYLADNAGIFLSDNDCHLVISKLKLGSELETDFITLSDGSSNGNIFEFIEIKQPSAKLFTDKGLI